MTNSELKEYNYISFRDYILSYEKERSVVLDDSYSNKKINLNNKNNTFNNLNLDEYFNPAKKYATFLEYRSGIKRLDNESREFLLKWLKISSEDENFYDDNLSLENAMADQDLDLLFTSVLFSTGGKTYYFVVQKTIADSMNLNLKIGDNIKLYIQNIGKYHDASIPVFLVVGYEKVSIMPTNIQNKIMLDEYYSTIQNDIYEKNFSKATGEIEFLLKKYPNDINLKLNLCLSYRQTNLFTKSISCYNDILKIDPNNYNALYGLSSTYYIKAPVNDTITMQNIVSNMNKVLSIIEGINQNPTGSFGILYYNSKYLRGMAKINLMDSTGINDLIYVNQKMPALIGSEIIEYYKKKLDIKK